MHDFVWADLSTFDPGKAERFYAGVLGWSFADAGPGYTVAEINRWQAAGLYPMPAFFRKIGMPSFWMSYIQVPDADAAAAKANELGAKIELQDESAFGRFALIRDPLGAGFTCIQNDKMASSRGTAPGRYIGSELVISDPGRAMPFYTGLFGWSFEPASHDRYTVHHADGRAIASVQVAPHDIKGGKEYWAVYFAVQDLTRAQRSIEQAGGQVVYAYDTSAGRAVVAHDDQGAAFVLTAG